LHDRHAKESRFCPNDRVWLAMLRRGKLERGWEGPYRVVEVMGPQTYRVRHHERKRRTLVVHSDRMKRRVYPAAGTSAAWCRLITLVRDIDRKVDAKTAATHLPAGLHPLRKGDRREREARQSGLRGSVVCIGVDIRRARPAPDGATHPLTQNRWNACTMMIKLANETRFTNDVRKENPVDASFIFPLNLKFCKYQQEPPTILNRMCQERTISYRCFQHTILP
ncbi:hypothetical protein T05_3975, partial [Trichinella murrelli]